jgi:hypothetical protein
MNQIIVGIIALGFTIFYTFYNENLPKYVKKKLLIIHPTTRELIEYALFTWNIFLYSSSITAAAFSFDLILSYFPDVIVGHSLKLSVFFTLIALGIFGGKLMELVKGNFD